jgi:alanine dehydrogenase
MTFKLSGLDVDKLVDVKSLMDLIERALTESPRPPPRTAIEYLGSWFGVMPASGLGYYVVKIVGVYPENPSRGLPLVRGTLLLFDPRSGDVLLEADAGPATGWRTATTTLVALKLMGYGGGALGIIGAGVQARYHLEVVRRAFGYDKLLVYSLTKARAEALAKSYDGRVAGSLRELLEASDTIIAATTSREPVVINSYVRSGALVASIGAPRPVRELEPELVRRGKCLLVDTREGVTSESDDWIGAESIVELSEALKGALCDWGDIRVYKSVGYSLLDLAIAVHLYERSRSLLGAPS